MWVHRTESAPTSSKEAASSATVTHVGLSTNVAAYVERARIDARASMTLSADASSTKRPACCRIVDWFSLERRRFDDRRFCDLRPDDQIQRDLVNAHQESRIRSSNSAGRIALVDPTRRARLHRRSRRSVTRAQPPALSRLTTPAYGGPSAPYVGAQPKCTMPSIQPFPLVVATLTFLLAGFVKGVIGLGLPTVSMGLLSLVMAPAKAASLLIVPSFVTNVWQLAAGPSFSAARVPALADAGGRGSRHARRNRIADGKPRGASRCRARASAHALRRTGPHFGSLRRSRRGRMVARASDRRA